MRLADSSEAKLSRFRILELLSGALFGLTCSGLAERTGQQNSGTRSFQASIATRLRRLRRLGLVRCDLDRLSRPAHSRRVGVYRWRLTGRGSDRLSWARSKKLI
jgi:hypothetical protein